MNKNKLEQLIGLLTELEKDEVENVPKMIQEAQQQYRELTGHYYHFRANAFYEDKEHERQTIH